MKIAYYEVSAFTSHPFGGNPAGVCPLDTWLPDATLQGIAANNNLAETAFLVPRDTDFELRWFTPTTEVDLCGHATLAAALVLFTERAWPTESIRFHTRSGALAVSLEGDRLSMDFPALPAQTCAAPKALVRGLGAKPVAVFKARDYLAVFASEAEVRTLKPDFTALQTLDCLGIIVTAPGEDCDFVSRFFAPSAGINEDPATGSAHCTLVPHWARQMGKSKLFARQVSPRGGEFFCELGGDRVRISGRAVLYLKGSLEVDLR